MFAADDIQARIRQHPFVPVRVVTSAGQTFDIFHPDLIMIGRRDLILGTASKESPTQYEQTSRVAILHETALKDLPASAAPKANGQQ